MQGTRLPDAVTGEPGPGWEAWDRGHCAPGSYMKVTRRSGSVIWFIVDPRGAPGTIIKKHHTVEEHDDRTITVSPSLNNQRASFDHESFSALIPTDCFGWHGWLERGVWRSC